MNLDSWYPALTTTVLFAAALWLARQLITARLSKSIGHEFDTRLETVRAEFSASEERLKAELREREADIAALRGGALSVLTSRQTSLDQRRLEAVDQIWAAAIALNPARAISGYLSTVNYEVAIKEAANNTDFRKIIEMMSGKTELNIVDISAASKARPFVTPMVWAIFVAIQATAMNAVFRWQALKSGLDISDFTNHEAIRKLILAVFPTYQGYLEKNGPDAYHYVLQSLDDRLLIEIQAMLAGADVDKANISRAAEIVRLASAAQPSTAPAGMVTS